MTSKSWDSVTATKSATCCSLNRIWAAADRETDRAICKDTLPAVDKILPPSLYEKIGRLQNQTVLDPTIEATTKAEKEANGYE